MSLQHPTNKKLTLLHSIDKHFQEKCHVLMVLKSAESLVHAMIAAMLPYLLWLHAKSKPGPKASAIKKWFKLAERHQAEDAFWCPKDKCIKNQSDLMLVAVLDNNNALYWEQQAEKPPSQKCKRPQVEEESLDDMVSTVQTAMSTKNAPKLALKGSPSTATWPETQMRFQSNSQMVASQVTTILQLTEMVSAVQQENKMILACFDQLAEQMAAISSSQTCTFTQSQARGHSSESSHPPWWLGAAGHAMRSIAPGIVHLHGNHPHELLPHLWMKRCKTKEAQKHGVTRWETSLFLLCKWYFRRTLGFLAGQQNGLQIQGVAALYASLSKTLMSLGSWKQTLVGTFCPKSTKWQGDHMDGGKHPSGA